MASFKFGSVLGKAASAKTLSKSTSYITTSHRHVRLVAFLRHSRTHHLRLSLRLRYSDLVSVLSGSTAILDLDDLYAEAEDHLVRALGMNSLQRTLSLAKRLGCKHDLCWNI
jgi:hypothetical protein